MDSDPLKNYLPLILLGIVFALYSVFFMGGYDSVEDKEAAENAQRYNQAVSNKNPSMCSGWVSSDINPMLLFYTADCVCDIINRSEEEEALCSSAEDGCIKVWCYSCYAIKYNDYRICEKSPDSDHCYAELCLSTMTPYPNSLEQESCKRINDSTTRFTIENTVKNWASLRDFSGCGMKNIYTGDKFYYGSDQALPNMLNESPGDSVLNSSS
jgi:hypothetical protein